MPWDRASPPLWGPAAHADILCTISGDGPLPTGAVTEELTADALPTDVQHKLHTPGWQTEPELSCTTNTSSN